MTQAQQLANLSQAYTAGALGWRNRFINGGHLINQRGSQNNAANGLSMCGADRWYTWPAGAGVTTGNDWQCPVSLGALHITGAAGNTGVAIGQRIERAHVWDMVGKQATVSGWVLVPVAGQYLTCAIMVPRGNDNYSGGWDTAVGGQIIAPNLPAQTWTYFSYTFTVPSACTAGMAVEFGVPPCLAGQNAALGGLQLEIGSIATPFEVRPTPAESALCLRYFNFIASLMSGGGMGQSGSGYFTTFIFPVMMRVNPTVTYANISYSSASGLASNSIGANQLRTGITATASAICYAIADVTLNAEL